MANLYLISVINCTLLKNAEHIQYHTNIMNIIEGTDPEAIGLEEGAYGPYTSALMEEQDIVNIATGSPYTPLMQEADAERTEVYRRIMRKLIVCEFENLNSLRRKAWGTIQKNLVEPYGAAVATLPLQEKTATLTGFIKDCREILTSEQVSAVGIDGDLDDLQMANQKYERMYMERLNEKSARETGYNATLRATTDATWKLLYTHLNALANSTDQAKIAKTRLAQEVVKKINLLTEETRQRITYRLNVDKAFIDKTIINGDATLTLPLPMEEVGVIALEGNKLSADNVKITVLEKGATGSKHKTFTVSEFVDRYDGSFKIVKDDATAVETMTISGFSLGSYQAVTIESVSLG